MLSGTKAPRPGHAEAVGGLLRSTAVTAAARRGSLADQHVLDDAMIDAVRLQEETGLDVITDGEVRRPTWAQAPRFLDCFTPIPGTGAAGAAGADCLAVTGRVRDAARLGDMTADYEALIRYLARRGGTPPRAKFTMPAPSYHRRYWSDERSTTAYRRVEEYLTEIRDYLCEAVSRLIALGCDYIQLEAPNYRTRYGPGTEADRDLRAALAFDADLDNSLLHGIKGVTAALHICRDRGTPDGGYDAISGELFPRLRFDRLLLEYGPEPDTGFEPLKDVPDGTVVVLGLVTAARATPGDKASASDQASAEARAAEAAVETRIAEAARLKPLPELALSARCESPSANPVTPASQRAALETVTRIARRVWD